VFSAVQYTVRTFMDVTKDISDEVCAIYVDMGTTNTRIWLMRGGRIIAHAAKPVGVRDTARDSVQQIRSALRELIAEVLNRSADPHSFCEPASIVAAGMISSPLGLADLPHIPTPAGIAELSASAQWFHVGDVTDLPILLVPGVRSGPANPDLNAVHETDVMRGEETLCAGLLTLGLVSPPAVVLNLGSHWKAIRLNSHGRIECSVTSLSGELIHAAQTQTILASSVQAERPNRIAGPWMDAGLKEQRRSGLARALFCVRLMDLAKQGTPEERLAFLVGAFIAADLDAHFSRGWLTKKSHVAIVGAEAMVEAWRSALAQAGVSATGIGTAEAETALLTGLRCILAHARPAPRIHGQTVPQSHP
jgi:2-dehydro-3-deoxygalactonokinase